MRLGAHQHPPPCHLAAAVQSAHTPGRPYQTPCHLAATAVSPHTWALTSPSLSSSSKRTRSHSGRPIGKQIITAPRMLSMASLRAACVMGTLRATWSCAHEPLQLLAVQLHHHSTASFTTHRTRWLACHEQLRRHPLPEQRTQSICSLLTTACPHLACCSYLHTSSCTCRTKMCSLAASSQADSSYFQVPFYHLN